MCTAGVRVKQLACFSACHYQIGDRAYYCLKPTDRVINLGGNVRCDKPAILHTYLRQKGLLREDANKKDTTAGDVTVASGTADDASQVTCFLVKFLFYLRRI